MFWYDRYAPFSEFSDLIDAVCYLAKQVFKSFTFEIPPYTPPCTAKESIVNSFVHFSIGSPRWL